MVKVIDSIMGPGKSSWAINYMKHLEDDNSIMYVTPYLKELDRIEQQTKPELNTFYFNNTERLQEAVEYYKQHKDEILDVMFSAQ